MSHLYSIIVSTKNNKNTIDLVLKSTLLLAEAYDTELLIIDGKSTDKTTEIVKVFIEQYKSRYVETKLIQDPGVSLSYSRHIGYKHSRGDVLIYLDGDTLLTTTFRHYLPQLLLRYDLIAPRYEILPLDKATKSFATFMKLIETLQSNSRKRDPSIFTPARIFKREVLKRLKGYPPLSRFFGEDRIVTALAAKHGFRYGFAPVLRLVKFDEPGYYAYLKKHFRYGLGINKDLIKYGKYILRPYIIIRRLTYINNLLPIFTVIYIGVAIQTRQSFKNSLLDIVKMKHIVDLSMFIGDIIGFLKK